jgi:hypothetical protein
MAQTEHLPIYKSMYDLCLYLEQVVHNFARYHSRLCYAAPHRATRRYGRLSPRAGDGASTAGDNNC